MNDQKKFPRLYRRGPIEAQTEGKHDHETNRFPRLYRRGPIEAWSVRQIWPLLIDVSAPLPARPH